MNRLGLIQSRGIGDIVIALPIAKYYSERGWQVFWPIDRKFLPSFQRAVDYVEFIPFDFTPSVDGFLMNPMRLLKEKHCEKIIPLYSHLSGTSIANADYFSSLKFDEYKYAIAGVPFGEKWRLQLTREPAREQALFSELVSSAEYVVAHRRGSNAHSAVAIPPRFKGYQIIEIDERTDCIFDWLLILERARYLLMIDSCFANLIDQLGLENEKTFIFRSEVRFTPVLRSNWQFHSPSNAARQTGPVRVAATSTLASA